MRWVAAVRSHKAFLVIALVVLALAVIENRQADDGHLHARSHPRTNPRLEAQALHEAASVLVERYPDRARPNVMMGTALAELGRLEEARVYLERAMEIEPRDQQLLFLYARLLVDLQADPEQIRDVVDQMRRYFPRTRDDVEAYFQQATDGAVRFDAAY